MKEESFAWRCFLYGYDAYEFKGLHKGLLFEDTT